MVSARKTKDSTPRGHVEVTNEIFERSVARVKAMTPTQFRQSLVDAGILTPKGNYTKPYRILGQSQSRATRATTR